MKYNIASVTDYLEELTGYKTRYLAHAKGKDKKLPLAITTSYSFYDLEFMETQVTIAIPTGLDGITPMQLAKHQAKMIEAFQHPVIFALESVASYQIARLTQAKVDFIVPGKIIFIPSRGCAIHRRVNFELSKILGVFAVCLDTNIPPNTLGGDDFSDQNKFGCIHIVYFSCL